MLPGRKLPKTHFRFTGLIWRIQNCTMLGSLFLMRRVIGRVPTGSGHMENGWKKMPCMEKSWNLKILEKSWNFGMRWLFWMSISLKFISLAQQNEKFSFSFLNTAIKKHLLYPAHKKWWGIMLYPQNFDCLSVRPSALRFRALTLVPFDLFFSNFA